MSTERLADGLGFEIPPHERTPLVEALLRVVAEQREEIRRLREEIDRLKGMPPRPQRQASSLEQPTPPDDASRQKKNKKRKKRRRHSGKRRKTAQLRIDETIPCTPPQLPKEARLVWHKDFIVQDLVLRSHNLCYRREVYQLPDGSHMKGTLPPQVRGHFGTELRAYVLYQYYQNHVTQPLILEELRELGVDISAGQIDRLLHEGHDAFHAEKASLLPAAREVSSYFQTDDTPGRHRGQNVHTHYLGNEFFAAFTTTDTKSRVNFLQLLRAPWEDYIVSGDALFYLEFQGLSQKLLDQLRAAVGPDGLFVEGDAAWWRQLDAWGITGDEPRRIVTEGALFGSLMYHDLYLDQPIISDDAGQFKILGYAHGLCWLHAERTVAGLVPLSGRQHRALERVRDQIWRYYQRLKAYRERPTLLKKTRLDRDFDRLFLQRTGWEELNKALTRLHAKKEQLLLVLEHPELPLHNNLAERDIREWAKKRKISAGTRSELGRRCRDTFLSLKKTCRKLGVSFWRYLTDRMAQLGEILPLPDLIRQAATADSMSPG